MRIALFNVKYSPNLGDGLLSECLEHELSAIAGDAVQSFDLAGRRTYGTNTAGRRTALAVLDALPPTVRRNLVRLALGRQLRTVLRPRWRNDLVNFDAVVLGGGNLLADHDLNFPLKVSAALAEASEASLPTAVFGVGLSDNWSVPGRRLYEEALRKARLCHAAVRDVSSQALWRRDVMSLGVPDAELCRDPGLLTAIHFPSARVERHSVTRVALGLTDPLALKYHAAKTAVPETALTSWLTELVRVLAQPTWEIVLFTNGSPEDRAYLARVGPSLVAQAPSQITVADAFANPSALAAFISDCDLLLAHRLHACIAAFSYGIPHIGFEWDPKVNAFFGSTQRSEFVVQPSADAPRDVVTLATRAIEAGIDAQFLIKVTDDARTDVARLRSSIEVARTSR